MGCEIDRNKRLGMLLESPMHPARAAPFPVEGYGNGMRGGLFKADGMEKAFIVFGNERQLLCTLMIYK